MLGALAFVAGLTCLGAAGVSSAFSGVTSPLKETSYQYKPPKEPYHSDKCPEVIDRKVDRYLDVFKYEGYGYLRTKLVSDLEKECDFLEYSEAQYTIKRALKREVHETLGYYDLSTDLDPEDEVAWELMRKQREDKKYGLLSKGEHTLYYRLMEYEPFEYMLWAYIEGQVDMTPEEADELLPKCSPEFGHLLMDKRTKRVKTPKR